MIRRDWSLVFFTMLAQASVGISLCLAVIMMLRPADKLVDLNDLGTGSPLLLALLLMAVATLVSFLHLGTPLNAPKALRNLKTSWLSREILAIQVYSLCLLVLMVLHYRSFETDFLWPLRGLLIASGVALLWSMSSIYMLPTLPPWKRWYTPVSFILTALTLGVLTLLLFGEAQWLSIPGPVSTTLRGALTVAIMIELISSAAHHAGLQKLPPGLQKPVFKAGAFHRVYLLRMVLLALLSFAMLLTEPPMVLVAVPLMVQEVLGRMLFYASYFRLGV